MGPFVTVCRRKYLPWAGAIEAQAHIPFCHRLEEKSMPDKCGVKQCLSIHQVKLWLRLPVRGVSCLEGARSNTGE